MRRAAIFSAILHLAVFLLAWLGLPQLRRDLLIAEPIPVEIVTIADVTNAPAAPKVEEKKEPEKPKEKPPEVKKPPAPPPPPPPPKAAPEPVAEEKAPKEKEEAAQEKKPVPPAPPPPPKPEPPRKKEEKKEPDFISSVLKNLEKHKPLPKEEKPEDTKEPPKEQASVPRENSLADEPMTISEQDAVRRQLEACWNVPAGARDAADLQVEIRAVINPDGTVRHAEIANTLRMATDSFYRAAAESALRAVLNPNCSPLKLPPEKYERWKDMSITFDPKDMIY